MASSHQEAIDRFFSVALELLCIADTGGHFIKLNKAWETTLGYPIEELEGRLFLDFVHPDDMPATLNAIKELNQGHDITRFVNRYRHKDGTYRYIEWRTTPVGTQIYAVARDITQEQQHANERETLLAELAKKNDELERFTYTVSHDLKAPLITIQGFARNMAESIETNDLADAKECLTRIQNGALRMGEMLQDLLRLSRLGRMSNPFAPTSLNDILKDVRETMLGLLNSTGSTLEVANDLPTVNGDSTRLRELFQNLIENAIKFRRPSQSCTIKVFAGQSADGNPQVCVQDNGIGILPAHQKSIFGLFQKLNPKTEGTGIGLSLVTRIAELHGAKVTIESEGKDMGTTFCVIFYPEKKV